MTSNDVGRSPATARPVMRAMSVLFLTVSPGLGVRISILTASSARGANAGSASAAATSAANRFMGGATLSRGGRSLRTPTFDALGPELELAVLLAPFRRRVGGDRLARGETDRDDARGHHALGDQAVAHAVGELLRERLAGALVALAVGVAAHDDALARLAGERAG